MLKLTWFDGAGKEVQRHQSVLAAFVANGQYGGGGMWIAPNARMDSGVMSMILVPELSTIRLLRYLPKLYAGTAGSAPDITDREIVRIHARPENDDRVRVDIDGEQPGILPAEFKIIPKAMFIRAQW